jgi:hypothetical protein
MVIKHIQLRSLDHGHLHNGRRRLQWAAAGSFSLQRPSKTHQSIALETLYRSSFATRLNQAFVRKFTKM